MTSVDARPAINGSCTSVTGTATAKRSGAAVAFASHRSAPVAKTIRNYTKCMESGMQVTKSYVPRKTKVRCGCGKLLSLTPDGRIPLHNKNVRVES